LIHHEAMHSLAVICIAWFH